MKRNYDLESLLEDKSFDQLDDQERAFVLAQLSGEEYEAHRKTVVALKEELSKTPAGPPAHLKEQVLASYNSSRRSPNPLWKSPIPLWKAIAAVAAAVFLMFWFGPVKKVLVASPPEKIMVYQTDTIFQTDTVERIVYQTKEIIKRVEVPVKPTNKPTVEEQPILQAKAPEKGKSAREVKDLMVFLSPSVKK